MSQKIVINFKVSTGAKLTAEIEPSATVGQLKAQLAESSKIPAEQQRLIFAGHVLKDHEVIESLGIKDGYTVHLVKGAAPSVNNDPNRSSTSTSNTPSTPSQTTQSPLNSGSGGLGALGGLGGLGGFGGDLSSMQQQMMQNPELMRNALNNPMVQSMLSNPEFLRSMFYSNPQLRQVIERNPEIGHALNDPSILRQTMQLMQNPQLMREMQRNTDRALSNIETHPEGFNALRRMYTQVQEPMMESAANMFSSPQEQSTQSNPFASIFQSPDPNTAPLPNPWAPGGTTSTTSNTNNTSTTASSSNPSSSASPTTPIGNVGSNPNPFAALGNFPLFPSAGSSTQSVPGQDPTPGLPSGFDLNSYAALMSNPMMQNMMQDLLADPAYVQQLVQSNPAINQMVQSNPLLAQSLSNPQFLQHLFQPQSLQALMQLQSSMNQLQGLFPQPQGNTTPSTPSPNSTQPPTGGANPFMFPFPSPSPNTSNVPPEQRFSQQLTALREMGFTDTQANIEALIASNGNVNAAVERLLSRS